MQYRTPNQLSIDGNTVEMDTERASFADNAVRYEASLRFLNAQIKALSTAINGQ
jgi:flagellar basal-body rod protein FlgB